MLKTNYTATEVAEKCKSAYFDGYNRAIDDYAIIIDHTDDDIREEAQDWVDNYLNEVE